VDAVVKPTFDLSGLAKKANCTKLAIADSTAAPAVRPNFGLKFTIGCVEHVVNFCKLPVDATEWASFVYTVLATDGVLLTHNVKTSILGSSGTELSLQFCGDCSIKIEAITPLATGLKVESAPLVSTAIVPKLGQFVAYAFRDGKIAGIQTYNPGDTVYAGFLNLPKSVPLDGCCLPSECDCTAVGSCRTIQRTGKLKIALSAPVAVPLGDLHLAVKPTGEIVTFSGLTPPTGFELLPFAHSIVFDERTIGSTLITVVLH
jgi:hypothetical protein